MGLQISLIIIFFSLLVRYKEEYRHQVSQYDDNQINQTRLFPSKSPVKTMYSLFQGTNREIVELPPT